MGQGIDMTVNRLPAPTWNWLRMNESRLTDIEAREKYDLKPQLLPEGLVWRQDAEEEDVWKTVATGMGSEVERLSGPSGAGADLLETAGVSAQSEQKPALFTLDYRPDSRAFNRLLLHAAPGRTLQAVITCRSGREASGLAALQIKAHAEKGARIRVYVVQLLGEGYTCLSDFGCLCEEEAEVELVRLELGAGVLYAGGLAELKGKGSRFTARIGYRADGRERRDMNYVARHYGRKTESLMEASGVLRGESFKLFRGTIDFVKGCAGSKGTESEDILMLGEQITNQTIPLILCGEEDVEGNHGASMGRLDESLLYYLSSRGIPREEAEQMMARAKIDAVAALIPDEGARAAAAEFLGQGKEEEAEDE